MYNGGLGTADTHMMWQQRVSKEGQASNLFVRKAYKLPSEYTSKLSTKSSVYGDSLQGKTFSQIMNEKKMLNKSW